MATQSRRVRFTVFEDVLLLQEIVAVNPFKDHYKWEDIQRKLVGQTGNFFSVRCIKEHTERMVQMYQLSLKKPEDGDEHEKLLQEIIELKCKFPKSRSAEKVIEFGEESIASLDADELVLEPYSLGVECIISEAEQSFGDTTPRTQNIVQLRRKRDHSCLQKDTLSYLQEKMRREQMLKEKELELEEKRLALEKKFEVEKKERKIRLEMEMKERESSLKNEDSQRQSNLTMQNVMIELINYLKNNKE